MANPVGNERSAMRERSLLTARRRAVAASLAFVVAASILGVFGSSALSDDARWAVPLGLSVGVPAFATVAYRAEQARRCLGARCDRVLVTGWVRVPDGYNYAVFSADHAAGAPKAVVRLPRQRRLHHGPAWICGVDLDAGSGAASLFTDDGTLIGFGRVRPTDEAAKVWARSGVRPPWWMIGPFQPPRLADVARASRS